VAKAIYIVIFHKFDDIVRFGKIKMDVFHDLFKRCFKVVINAGRTSCPDFDFDLFVNVLPKDKIPCVGEVSFRNPVGFK
jgi:hypothetical protein